MKPRPRIHYTERQSVLMSMGPSPKVLRGIVSRERHSRCAVRFWHTQAKFLPASLQTFVGAFFWVVALSAGNCRQAFQTSSRHKGKMG